MPLSTVKGRGEKPKVKLPSLKQAKNKIWEDQFEFQLKTHGLGDLFVREWIAPDLPKKWKWDFADPKNRIVIEVQGSIWAKGKTGHTSGVGILRDHEKGNAATFEGYHHFQVSSDTIRNLKAIDMLVRFYKEKVFI